MNRSIHRLYIALALGFVLVCAMLAWWQVIRADSLNERAGNRQALQRERLTDRGRIRAADGALLATSRARRVNGQRVFERVYPRPLLAPHVLGYTSEDKGRTGIEDSQNRYLGGSFGTGPLLERFRLRTKRGASVQLTIRPEVQQAGITGLAGRPGAVVALNPQTGAVLAMVSSPSYDPSKITTDFESITRQPNGPLVNRAVAGRYAPGSTFKVITAVAALDSGSYEPRTRFADTGSFVVNGRAIRNFGGAVFANHDLTFALTKSVNTTFARVGDVLGARRLGDTMTAFGFGGRPPIDLPEDAVAISGRFRDGALLDNGDTTGDAARLAIGQEALQVTPLQMALVTAAIANGGTRVRPYLVRRVTTRSGEQVAAAETTSLGTATSATTAAAVAGMMRRVVQEGTGTQAALSGLSVAGKTGTAETGVEGRNNAWFIGFAPAEAPQIAVAVVIEGTPGTGGGVAAPVAAAVMRAALGEGG